MPGLALLVACADQATSVPEDALVPVPSMMEIVSGQDQQGTSGTQLSSPLVVRVLDSSGEPIAEQIVNFRVTEGGGSVFAGTALTNASGIAQEWWTLGPGTGTNTLEARAVNADNGEKLVFATFRAEATAPVASVAVSPSSQSVTAGSTFELTATVTDVEGGIVSSPNVTWSSSNTSVATVASTGPGTAEVTAVSAGSATIAASSGGKSGTSEATVTAPPPPPPPPSSVLAGHDFEDGTLGPFRYLYTQFPGDLQVVDDPTGAGKGKLVRLHYQGNNQDRNRSFAWQPSQPFDTPGSSVFFRGELNLGTWNGAADDQRKLLYWLDHPSSSAGSVYSILYLMGTTLYYQGGSVAGVKTFRLPAQLTQDRWYTIELQVTLNSAYDRSDGVARLWVDGEMVWEDTTMRFLPASGYSFGLFMVGDQVNANEAFDEHRFWDNVAFGTARLQ